MNLKKIIAYIKDSITTRMDAFPVRLLLLENSILWRQYKPYKTIDFIPCWNYHKLSETNDMRYLLKLSDYDNLPNYPKNLLPPLQDIYRDLQEQVYSHIKSDNHEYSEELSAEIFVLKAKYDALNAWLRLVWKDVDRRDEHIKEVEKYGYTVDKTNLLESLTAIQKKSGLILNKIGVKVREYEELKPEQTGSQEKTQTFEEVVALIQRNTARIDVHKTSQRMWMSIQTDYINSLPKPKNG